MAHFDLHEQEQLTKIKYFWRDWGKYIVGIVVVAMIAYVSNVLWVANATSNATKAAVIYNQINDAVKAKDNATVYKLTDDLKNKYSRVEYTAMASIIAAKVAIDAKDMDKATTYLDWVIKKAKDKGMVAIAMLRLSDVYIDQKKFDLAHTTLMKDHDASFDSLFYAKRGDLYVAQGDLSKARDAYKAAIDKAGQDQNMAGSIQMKLDVLGG
jgi:predicted negative regulator of RcsB-dependent stress response